MYGIEIELGKKGSGSGSGGKKSSSLKLKSNERIHIALAFCGQLDRVYKFKTVLQSTILMSESEIEFHLIVEDMLKLETEILVL